MRAGATRATRDASNLAWLLQNGQSERVDEAEVRAKLERHWEYGGSDQDIAHEIYHDDAVLEFPQSGERFVGVENFREWRRIYPASLAFEIRNIRGRDDLWVAENSISYDGGPGTSPSASSSFEATRWSVSRSTSPSRGSQQSAGALESSAIVDCRAR